MTMTMVRLQDPPVIEVHTRVQLWTLHGDVALTWLGTLPEPPLSDPSTGRPAPNWRASVDPVLARLIGETYAMDAKVNVVNTDLPPRHLLAMLGPGYELAPWAAERWDADMCAQWCLIEPSTWRSYVARGTAPESLADRNRHNGRVEWDALEVRVWHGQERAGQGARTDLQTTTEEN